MNWNKAVFHVPVLDMCMATKRISIDFIVLKGYVKKVLYPDFSLLRKSKLQSQFLMHKIFSYTQPKSLSTVNVMF